VLFYTNKALTLTVATTRHNYSVRKRIPHNN